MKNTKSLLLSAVLMLFLFHFHQEGMSQNTSIGLRTGVNVSNFGGENGQGDALLGANFGAFGIYSISPKFGTAVEINYMMKGAKDEGSDNKTSVNYMEIPLYANMFLNTSGKVRAKIIAGPTLGFLMTAKRDAGDTSTDVKENYNSTDLGGLLGAGAHILISDENWLWIDMRYGFGFTDITKAGNTNVRNNVFSVNVGVSFPLGNY